MFEVKAYGKINLSLEVIGKRPDSYHNIDTLMTRIDVFDKLSFEKTSTNDIIILSENKDLPLDESNLIYKAWSIMKEFTDENPGIKVCLEKNIPIAAGLAGGTSDGVATIKALNQLWALNFSNDQLKHLAQPLGADSSFFFYDGLVRAQGLGDKITELDPIKSIPLLIVNIGKPVSSAEVYKQIKSYSQGRVSYLVENINDYKIFKTSLYNSMEEVTFSIYPELKEIKSSLLNLGADFSLMSGSGPSIFAGFANEDDRDQVYELIKDKYKYVFKNQMI